ncbi:MAG: C39 family peptidase, partial [bacterium]
SKSGDKSVAVSLKSTMIVSEDELNRRQAVLQEKADEIRSKAELRWKRTKVENLEFATNQISGVEAYTWYRGCSSTSLAMIFNYHGSHGYSNLLHPVSTFSWNGPNNILMNPTCPRDLVDHFANFFGFPQSGGVDSDYGSSASQQRNAIIDVAEQHGYKFTSSVDSSHSYTTFQNEIDNNRPIKVGYDTGAGRHAVCGFGYDFGTDHRIAVYNTWDLNPHVMVCENEAIWNWVTVVPPQNIISGLVIDRSGSMGSPDKLPVAKSAARYFVDASEAGDEIAISAFDHNPLLVFSGSPD